MLSAGDNQRSFADRGIGVNAKVLAYFRHAILDDNLLFLYAHSQTSRLGYLVQTSPYPALSSIMHGGDSITSRPHAYGCHGILHY